jgi:hypothetical protein
MPFHFLLPFRSTMMERDVVVVIVLMSCVSLLGDCGGWITRSNGSSLPVLVYLTYY